MYWVEEHDQRLGRKRWFGRNLDGTDHWDECSRRRKAIVRREGVPFERPPNRAHGHQKGHHWRGKDKLNYDEALPMRGRNYRPLPCDAKCKTAPWLICIGCKYQPEFIKIRVNNEA